MKSWWKSKTVWVNVVVIAGAMVTVLVGNEWVMSDPQLAGVLLALSGGLNMVLRLFTNEAIK